jgi:2-polyprenyl-3-methyl-5-hydroxy-6-metoxy-1,4-benzoquinol methylase
MKQYYDRRYTEGQALWTKEEPPLVLVNLVNQMSTYGRALDVGCGEGFYSKFLAEKGFDVTGIDFSEPAIDRARSNASGVDFRVIDAVQGDLSQLGQFDFCLEWSTLHCFPPEQRAEYVAKIAEIMSPGAVHLSTCVSYSAEPGTEEEEMTEINELWLPPLNKVIELFSPFYDIIEATESPLIKDHKESQLCMRRR